jgi:hypothetical protein
MARQARSFQTFDAQVAGSAFHSAWLWSDPSLGGLPVLGCLPPARPLHQLNIAMQPQWCRAQRGLLFKLVDAKYVGSIGSHHVGVLMLFMCFALLGGAASRAVRLPGLLLIVSVLAVAIGIEGVVSHRALGSVLLIAVLMLVVVEWAYVAASLIWKDGAHLLDHWKTWGETEGRRPRD